MEYLYSEIKSLAAFLMLVNILMLMLPGEKYNKHFKVISGMILILIIINPITKLMNNSMEFNLFNAEDIIIEEKKSLQDINDSIYEISLREYEKEVEKQYINKLCGEGFPVENINIEMTVSDTSVDIIHIEVKMGEDAKNYGKSLENATNQYIKSCFKNDMSVEEEIIEIKY